MDAQNPQHPPRNPAPFPSSAAAQDFLHNLYLHLPLMVLQLTPEGVVTGVNPEVARVTGFPSEELVGKNLWATLFPGRLFSQVPRFISAVTPSGYMRDVPLTIRTKTGQDKIVAFTRFIHVSEVAEGDSKSTLRRIICIGNDLTDRLTDVERTVAAINAMPGNPADFEANPAANAEATPIEGDIVTPIAATPPAPSGDANHAIDQVHEFLTLVDTRVSELQTAFNNGEFKQVESLADALRDGASACGLLSFSAAAERLRTAALRGHLDRLHNSVQEVVALAKK